MEWLAQWPVAVALRQSALAYPLVNAAHILGIGLLLGSIATLDLRMLGLFRAAPMAVLAPPLWRMAGCGLGLAAATGFLLFSTRPGAYLDNPAFLLKLGLLALGLLNILALHLNPAWKRALAGGEAGAALRLPALLSLLAWVGAVLSGRWIGFLL
ncbi:DUF2214 domain-containing protein [Pseudoroseomonas ludipueritiae]|uniref:DUF2214 domain-containing protein n=1 Tax=Pseudoroseomonas ludipueritiae TaxID=198093 RepID=A0ABR7R8T0_9PROT|nr:DUF2214 domain-containing protein [Pseudoroseomonas ludipueritiae]